MQVASKTRAEKNDGAVPQSVSLRDCGIVVRFSLRLCEAQYFLVFGPVIRNGSGCRESSGLLRDGCSWLVPAGLRGGIKLEAYHQCSPATKSILSVRAQLFHVTGSFYLQAVAAFLASC